MAITFITKNKIADYIEQHPEAQTSFLTWLKEYPYWQGKDIFKQIESQPIEGILTCCSGLGRGDYQIQYKFNPWLKTGYITWLGTKEALVEYEQAEFEKMKIQNPDMEWKVVTTTVVLQVSDIPGRATNQAEAKVADLSETKETLQVAVGIPVDLTDVHLGKAPEIFPSKIEGYIVSKLDFKTKTEYEKALNKAIAIFDARPGTPEFDELALLLPLIRHYEASNIELPRLTLLDVIKLKMKELEMPASFLTNVIGSQEDVNLFLAGKNSLSNKTLQALCNKLYIRIPLNDNSLIK
jgi:antitoxin component HigA of HigAB toxin-antitoxin module